MPKKRQKGVYRSILLRVFEKGTREAETRDIVFSQADLRRAADELGFEVRNFPDLTYNLRSRSPLPQEIIDAGYTTIAIRGRGQYALVMQEETVEIPPDTNIIEVSTAAVPEAIRDIIRDDEQSILSVVRHLNLVTDFAGSAAYHLQGHLRTTGGLGQQVEADDVWVAERPDKTRVIVPIEAKGKREKLGRHQIMSTIDAVLSKMPGFEVIPLAVKLEDSGLLLFVEFNYDLKESTVTNVVPTRFRRYRLEPKLPLWP